MGDPISPDDAYGAPTSAAPTASAPVSPISADDAYAGAPATEKSVPQFEGVWRKPAMLASNMFEGAVTAVPKTLEFLFGPDPNHTITQDEMSPQLADEIQLRAFQDETAGRKAKTVQQYIDDINTTQHANAYRTTKAIDAGLAATGVANRPDLQPQDETERLLAAGAQGTGAALLTGGAGGAPALALNAARGFGGGVGSEIAGELFPHSAVAPLVGGALGAGAVETPRLATAGARALTRPFTQAGQSDAVGDLIRKAAVNPASLDNLPEAPLPGMDLTLGQLSNDPGIQALERGIEGNTPAAQGAVNARIATNNAVVRNAIGSLHSEGSVSNPVDAMADASTRMRDALDANLSRDRTQERTLWSGLDAEAPTSDLKSDVASYASGKPVSVDGTDLRLSKARQRFLPDDVVQMVNDLSPTEPLNELTDLRSVISTAQREASNAGEWNKANVLGGLDKIVLNRINNLDVPPAQIEQYTAARDFSKQLNEKYSQGPVARVLGTDATGADRIAPTATGGQFFKSGPGGLEALQSYAKAVGDNAEGVQAAKDYAVANMLKQGSSSRALDQNGLPKVDFGSLNNHLNNNQHVLESGLFSPEELDQIEAAHLGADMSSRTARSQLPYGSSTAEKIKSGQYVEFPLHPVIPKVLGMAAGAIGGGHVGGPVGSIVGAMEGGNLASKVYRGPNAKIGEALQQRLLHPDAAPPSP